MQLAQLRREVEAVFAKLEERRYLVLVTPHGEGHTLDQAVISDAKVSEAYQSLALAVDEEIIAADVPVHDAEAHEQLELSSSVEILYMAFIRAVHDLFEGRKLAA